MVKTKDADIKFKDLLGNPIRINKEMKPGSILPLLNKKSSTPRVFDEGTKEEQMQDWKNFRNSATRPEVVGFTITVGYSIEGSKNSGTILTSLKIVILNLFLRNL